MGFGTGLNALLTLRQCETESSHILYKTIDTNPIPNDMAWELNYCEMLGRPDLQPHFEKMHSCNWNEQVEIRSNFQFEKFKMELQSIILSNEIDIIYFDAFAPAAQPELWTEQIFRKLFDKMKKGGLLVTYCSKGDVRRALSNAGFMVKKLAGPAGKREILRAVKS